MDTFRQDSFRFGRKRKEIILNTYRMEPKITPRQIYPTIYKKLRRIVSSLAKAGLDDQGLIRLFRSIMVKKGRYGSYHMVK